MIKLQQIIDFMFALVALVILADFGLPGHVQTTKITSLEKEHQQYYNAARNYHYSYKINTGQHQFSVSESFAKTAHNQQQIAYSVSRIFKEVNWYKLPASKTKSYYSFRLVAGCIFPLLALIAMFIPYWFNVKMGNFLLVLKLVLLADLIILIT